VTASNDLFFRTVAALERAGCVAADEEAIELIASVDGDSGRLDALVARRSSGEPLAWLTGRVTFCDVEIVVDPGVYVPRPQSWPLAERAWECLPSGGVAVDLGTGSGAIAAAVARRRPDATVIGTEVDPLARRCAKRNGVTVVSGPLFDGLPLAMRGAVDVVVGVLPYVPSDQLQFLPRDVLAYEPRAALDGGEAGLKVLSAAVSESAKWLRDGGTLLLEVGGEQPTALGPVLSAAGFTAPRVLYDAEGDARGVEAVAVWRHVAR
jgi:release factor glutamine methyltransferase